MHTCSTCRTHSASQDSHPCISRHWTPYSPQDLASYAFKYDHVALTTQPPFAPLLFSTISHHSLYYHMHCSHCTPHTDILPLMSPNHNSDHSTNAPLTSQHATVFDHLQQNQNITMNDSDTHSNTSSTLSVTPFALPLNYSYSVLIAAFPLLPAHLIFYDEPAISLHPASFNDTTEVQLCYPLLSFLPDIFAGDHPLLMQDLIAKHISINSALRNTALFLTRQLQSSPDFANYRTLLPFLYNQDLFMPSDSGFLYEQIQVIAIPLPLSLARNTFSPDFAHFQDIRPCGLVRNPHAQDSIDCPPLTVTLFGTLQHEEDHL